MTLVRVGESCPSAEIQSVYSTAVADWAATNLEEEKQSLD